MSNSKEERFITSGVSWQQYEALLETLGNSLWYRVTYLEGVLEILDAMLEFRAKLRTQLSTQQQQT